MGGENEEAHDVNSGTIQRSQCESHKKAGEQQASMSQALGKRRPRNEVQTRGNTIFRSFSCSS